MDDRAGAVAVLRSASGRPSCRLSAAACFWRVQAALLVTTALQARSAHPRDRRGEDRPMRCSRCRASRTSFHIVLDGFQSDVFPEILEAERPTLERSLSGFVFFDDHAGAFPTTMVSVPAMLTGTAYRQEQPLQKYIRDHFQKGSIFGTLRARGYRVDSVTEMDFDSQSATNFYRVPRPYVGYEALHAVCRVAARRPVVVPARSTYPAAADLQQSGMAAAEHGSDRATRQSAGRHHPVNGAAVLDEFARRL